MSTTKHTPGPWELSYDQGSYRDIMTKDARVCTVRHSYVSRETYSANARLIAASPDLAYQLGESIHMIERLRGWIKAIADGTHGADRAADVLASSGALNESNRIAYSKATEEGRHV